jgi:hypothetical protein
MTPDDKAMARVLRCVETDAAVLAGLIEDDRVPWPGELLERLQKMAKAIDTQVREVQHRRPRLTRGRSW